MTLYHWILSQSQFKCLSHCLSLSLFLAGLKVNVPKHVLRLLSLKTAGEEERTASEKESNKTITNNERSRKEKFVIGNRVSENLWNVFPRKFQLSHRKKEGARVRLAIASAVKMQTRFDFEKRVKKKKSIKLIHKALALSSMTWNCKRCVTRQEAQEPV